MEKRDVKPFINTGLKDTIYKLSFVTGYSVKGICTDLCSHAFRIGVGEELSPYFKRAIKIGGVTYEGQKNPKKFERNLGEVERISLKLSNNLYEYAYSLSYAIGCSVAKVVAYCIERSMRDYDFLDFYINKFLNMKMDESRKEMMKKIMHDVNKKYLSEESEDHSIASLLLFIVDEYKQADESVESVLNDFVSQ